MLVRVQRGAGQHAHGLSGAEAKVHDLLAGWAPGTDHAIGGFALLNVNVPHQGTTRQVDGLLFLPAGLAVLEVKGFTKPQSGPLTLPPNGPWLVGDEPAAIHALAGLPNPGEQVKAAVYAAKETFAGIPGGGDAFVRGLVVLVATGAVTLPPGHNLAGKGIDVALATPTSLRRVLHRYRAQPPVWTADGVLAACEALALTELAPTRGELLTEGFAEQVAPPADPPADGPRPASPRGSSPRPLRPVTPQEGAPPAGPPVEGPRPASPTPRPLRPVTTTPAPPPPARRADLPRPRPASEPTTAARPARRIPWGLIVVLVLLCAVGITAAVIVGQVFHGD
ncbi:nuclease-related domain-containing protein [Amycolatopsis sp. cmx-4-68]|uniref:nuclease-related domain-containing protein n=1 Tax=Amycolatopsis sp. cmx-4-68 TaxID=2790938 RepID=UPI003978307B